MKDLINIIEKLKVSSKTEITKRADNWTIEDAKDGDIVISNTSQFIYKSLDTDKKYCSYPTAIVFHACYVLAKTISNKFKLCIGPDVGVGDISLKNRYNYRLSNEEECKELFDALRNKGYKWDSKKLKLVKI